jgi:hypothetical protein
LRAARHLLAPGASTKVSNEDGVHPMAIPARRTGRFRGLSPEQDEIRSKRFEGCPVVDSVEALICLGVPAQIEA